MRKGIFASLLAVTVFTFSLRAQTAGDSSISGRITADDKPLVNAVVTLNLPALQSIQNNQKGASVRTDKEGRYEFAGLSKGSYLLTPRAFQYAISSSDFGGIAGKTVYVGEGEHRTNVDFDLTIGGVITGKVVDERNRPLIRQMVYLSVRGQNQQITQKLPQSPPGSLTDDRGIYRLYGLQAGSYFVSVGNFASNRSQIGWTAASLPRTYFPGTVNLTEAREVVVSPGKESSGIDIKVGPGNPEILVKGRVIDAATGVPIPNIGVDHSLTVQGSDRILSAGGTLEMTDSEGNFVIHGLQPGRYAIFVRSQENSDLYSENEYVSVDKAEVENLEIKAVHGASISGRVILQEGTDPGLARLFGQMRLSASSMNTSGSSRTFGASAKRDGSFEISGIAPGKIRFSLLGASPLQLIAIEFKGAPVSTNLQVASGEKVSGVKIVVGAGTGSIKGIINFPTGSVPPDLKFSVFASRQTSTPGLSSVVGGLNSVDSSGRFLIENLLPGSYRVNLLFVMTGGAVIPPEFKPQTKLVEVGTGETQLTFEVSAPTRQVKQ